MTFDQFKVDLTVYLLQATTIQIPGKAPIVLHAGQRGSAQFAHQAAGSDYCGVRVKFDGIEGTISLDGDQVALSLEEVAKMNLAS